MRLGDGLMIGLAQVLALAPGTSRSGITITAARYLGFDRDGAARVSFLLLIPAVAGATVYSAYEAISDGLPDDVAGPIIVGTIASAISGYLAIAWLLRLVRTHSYGRSCSTATPLGLRPAPDRDRRSVGDVLYRLAIPASMLAERGIAGLRRVSLVLDLQQLVPPARAPPGGSSARRRTARRAAGRLASGSRGSRRRRPTIMCAEIAGIPVVTSQTWRSWTSTTPASAASASPIRSRVEPAGRRLHEDPARLAEQAVGGPEHQGRDQQRGDPVGALEPPHQDHRAGDRGRDEGEEVGDDVQEGALDVEAAPLRPGDQPRRDQVDPDPDHGHDQDQGALHLGRVDQPPDALEDDQPAEQQQRDAVDLGREDLGAPQPVGEAAARRPLGQPQRDQRQRRSRPRR